LPKRSLLRTQASGIDRNGRIGGTVRLHRDQIPSNPKFVYVFCLLDRRKMELTPDLGRTVSHLL
jgi:hypothetical protein